MKKILLTLLASFHVCSFVFAQNFDIIEHELQEIMIQENNGLISTNIILHSEIDTEVLRNNVKNIKERKSHRQAVVDEFKSFAQESQKDIISILEDGERNGDVKNINPHWLSNTISCEISRDYIELLSKHPDVKLIGYNEVQYLLWNEEATIVPTERAVSKTIGYVNADDVWEQGYTGEGVVVAVLDTGVNEHADIKNNLWDGGDEYPNHGYNTFENTIDVSDSYGHGTHCAGIIVGEGISGTKTGIAPDATLMCIKVMDDGGNGTAEGICSGIEFAIEHGADVINMSLGFPNAAIATREMLRNTYINALEANVAIITAVGNDGMFQISSPVPNNVRVPGGCPPPYIHPDQEENAGGVSACIAVGAVDFNNIVAPFSSYGPFSWQNTSFRDYQYNGSTKQGLIRPDVCAPGVGIVSCDPNNNNRYVNMDGTSQAAPCVTGIVCLMLQKNPNLTPAQICETLETTATKLSDTKSNYTGSGCVDALKAINNIEESTDTTMINNIYENMVNIYPNPTENIVFIKTNETINETIIYNIIGIPVSHNNSNINSIDVSDLEHGIYFIKIKTDTYEVIKQFIKN